MKSSGNLWALILAGGEGMRVRDLTKCAQGNPVPKQFFSLDGTESLLRWTVSRAARIVPMERIVTVVADQHRRWWEKDLSDFQSENVIVQPENRGTAPGILLPLLEILRRDRMAKLIVMPSDHYVESEDVLQEALLEAVETVHLDNGRVLLLGITPEACETGFGWIVSSDSPDNSSPARVEAFIEKPDWITAQMLMSRGALVNSLIFVTTGTALLEIYALAVPQLLRDFIGGREEISGKCPDLSRLYRSLETYDFSREVLERSYDYLSVLPVPACGWTDIGSPERLKPFQERRAPVSRTTQYAVPLS